MATFCRRYPLASHQRRIVADVLKMTTSQPRHPVRFFVTMVADDGLLRVQSKIFRTELIPLAAGTRPIDGNATVRTRVRFSGRIKPPWSQH